MNDASRVNLRTDISSRTINNLRQAQGHIIRVPGKDRLQRDFTPGDGDELWQSMLNCLGENTVKRHMARTKQFMRAAHRRRLIESDPFSDIKGCSVQADESRLFLVTREMADKVIEFCLYVQW